MPLNEDWLGITYGKTVRALVEICVGCISYELSRNLELKAKGLKATGRVLVTMIGVLAIALPLYWMTVRLVRPLQIPGLLLFGAGVAFIFSGAGYFQNVFRSSLWGWLGRYSFSLYLGQGIPQQILANYYGAVPLWMFVVVYIVVALASGLAIHVLATLLIKGWRAFLPWFRRTVFVQPAE